MAVLRNFLRLPHQKRALLVEAFLLSGVIRLAVLLVPFRRIEPLLKKGIPADPSDPGQALLIGWAVRTAARRTPWRSTCLVQAIAARLMLRRRGLGSTLYFGVSTRDRLRAHAWLRCGDQILTGGDGHEEYQVISAIS